MTAAFSWNCPNGSSGSVEAIGAAQNIDCGLPDVDVTPIRDGVDPVVPFLGLPGPPGPAGDSALSMTRFVLTEAMPGNCTGTEQAAAALSLDWGTGSYSPSATPITVYDTSGRVVAQPGDTGVASKQADARNAWEVVNMSQACVLCGAKAAAAVPQKTGEVTDPFTVYELYSLDGGPVLSPNPTKADPLTVINAFGAVLGEDQDCVVRYDPCTNAWYLEPADQEVQFELEEDLVVGATALAWPRFSGVTDKTVSVLLEDTAETWSGREGTDAQADPPLDAVPGAYCLAKRTAFSTVWEVTWVQPASVLCSCELHEALASTNAGPFMVDDLQPLDGGLLPAGKRAGDSLQDGTGVFNPKALRAAAGAAGRIAWNADAKQWELLEVKPLASRCTALLNANLVTNGTAVVKSVTPIDGGDAPDVTEGVLSGVANPHGFAAKADAACKIEWNAAFDTGAGRWELYAVTKLATFFKATTTATWTGGTADLAVTGITALDEGDAPSSITVKCDFNWAIGNGKVVYFQRTPPTVAVPAAVGKVYAADCP